MIEKNFSFYVDPYFKRMFDSSDDHVGLKTQIVEFDFHFIGMNFRKLAEDNIATIFRCSDVDYMLNDQDPKVDDDQKPINFHYKVSKQLYTLYLNFLISHNSPFGDRLGELVIRVFEAGIKQHLMKRIPHEEEK